MSVKKRQGWPFLLKITFVSLLSLGIISCQQENPFTEREDLVISHASLQTQLFSDTSMNSLSKQILIQDTSQKLVNEALSQFLLENYVTFKSEMQSVYPITKIQWIGKLANPSASSMPLSVMPVKVKDSPSPISHIRSIQGGVPFDQLLNKSVAYHYSKDLKANYFIGFRIELTWKEANDPNTMNQTLGPKYGETPLAWQRYVADSKESTLQAKMKIWLVDDHTTILYNKLFIAECPLSMISVVDTDLKEPHRPFIKALSILSSQLKASMKSSLRGE